MVLYSFFPFSFFPPFASYLSIYRNTPHHLLQSSGMEKQIFRGSPFAPQKHPLPLSPVETKKESITILHLGMTN